jgi:hypothetical protein
VGKDSASGGPVFVIWQVELLSGISYNFRYFGVMDVTNVWENMVFDLMIQATSKPIDNSIFGRKINRRIQLMNGPRVFHVAC